MTDYDLARAYYACDDGLNEILMRTDSGEEGEEIILSLEQMYRFESLLETSRSCVYEMIRRFSPETSTCITDELENEEW